MVFTSAPNYIDSTNWTQQINRQAGCNLENMQQTALSLPEGFSMDRAQPKAAEKAVKCPRCGSRNTKFCYFNNYSLSQPRYICKTCRRYWTRGGALRSVPMGGGCRKNKNDKSTRCAKSKTRPKGSASTSTSTSSSKDASPSSSFTIGTLNLQPPQFSFMNSLHQINDYGSSGMDLNFGSFQPPTGLPMENSASFSDVDVQSRSIMEQWRQQQLPCLTGFETQQAYFNIGANEGLHYDMGGGQAWVKMEEDQRVLNGAVAMGGQISLYQRNFK